MTLREMVQRAKQLATDGDYTAAERMLAGASIKVADEPDEDVLDEYAEACKEWGSDEDEERALREIVRRDVRPGILLRLLDLLQQRLNMIQGIEYVDVVRDCLRIGSEVLELVPAQDVDTRANIQYSRGLRHLDLARVEQAGHLDAAEKDGHLDAAAKDIEAYVGWLLQEDSIPKHLQRDNLIALAQVEMGEVLLLQGRTKQAAVVLEEAIQSLEDAKVAGWMTSKAYGLLEIAWSEEKAAFDGGEA